MLLHSYQDETRIRQDGSNASYLESEGTNTLAWCAGMVAVPKKTGATYTHCVAIE